MRVVLGALLGSIAFYVWMTAAHMLLPLGKIGFSQMPNEAPVTAAMQASIPKGGLYMFPWVNPSKDMAAMMKEYDEKTKASPSGLLLIRPAGQGMEMKPTTYIMEFVSEFIQCLMAAFVLGLAGIAAYVMRVAAVVAIGIAASISTNLSYDIWYGFPHAYTHAQILIILGGYVAAGLVIAAIVKPKAA